MAAFQRAESALPYTLATRFFGGAGTTRLTGWTRAHSRVFFDTVDGTRAALIFGVVHGNPTFVGYPAYLVTLSVSLKRGIRLVILLKCGSELDSVTRMFTFDETFVRMESSDFCKISEDSNGTVLIARGDIHKGGEEYRIG